MKFALDITVENEGVPKELIFDDFNETLKTQYQIILRDIETDKKTVIGYVYKSEIKRIAKAT